MSDRIKTTKMAIEMMENSLDYLREELRVLEEKAYPVQIRTTSYVRCTRCNGRRDHPEHNCTSDWHGSLLMRVAGYTPPLGM